MEFYSDIRKNDTTSFKGMELEDIMLNEVSQVQKEDKSHMFLSHAEDRTKR
jgi:hypothetical protein